MKRILIMLLMSFIMTFANAQAHHARHYHQYVDVNKYEVVDSFMLERITITSQFDYDDDKIIDLGYGDYLIEMPHKDKFVIRKNKENTKAIVVYNSYCFGRHKEFNIKDDDKRTILWYEDEHLYCGYVYDKAFKVIKYFETNDYMPMRLRFLR